MSKKLIQQIEVAAEKSSANRAAVAKLKKMDAAQAQQFFTNLSDYWKVIRLVLQLVKVFTGKKADAKIDEIIEWGNANL